MIEDMRGKRRRRSAGDGSGRIRYRALLMHAAAAVLLIGIAGTTTARAQAVNDAFGGFARNSNAPIDIESDSLEVQDGEKIAIFRGNVKAVQAGMTMRSKELRVRYTGGQKTAGAAAGTGSRSEITHIRANGKVLISTEQNQNTTSDWADFDVKSQRVVIGGNVVLSQGGNVLKGDRLVIDLKTGRSRFESDGGVANRGRVKGLFMPGQLSKQPAAEAGAESGSTGADSAAPRQ